MSDNTNLEREFLHDIRLLDLVVIENDGKWLFHG